MGFFNRSKNTKTEGLEPKSVSPPPKKCNHKFQDFPWYVEGTESDDIYSRHWYHSTIKEPYVCIYCGERQDKILWEIKRYGPQKEAMQALDDVNERFKDHIRYRAEIEDMINDMQLVDPQYLQYYHMLQGTKDPSTSRLYEEKIKPKLKV